MTLLDRTAEQTASPSSYDLCCDWVRERAKSEGVDCRQQRDRTLQIISQVVNGQYPVYANEHSLPSLSEPEIMVERVSQAIFDYGPFTAPLRDPAVKELFVEGEHVWYYDHTGHPIGLVEPTTAVGNRRIIEQLLQDSKTKNKGLTDTNPKVKASLGGRLRGRLIASIPPISGDRLISAQIRLYTMWRATLAQLVANETLTVAAATFLWALLRIKARIVVSGQPGAGKTTMLGALLEAVPAEWTVRCVEFPRELPLWRPTISSWEAQDIPGFDIRSILKDFLGMRPHYIVLGELLGEESFDLQRAINAGSGAMCTLHANSAAEAPDVLATTAVNAAANVSLQSLREIYGHFVDVVVHMDVAAGDPLEGTPECHRVMEIALLRGYNDGQFVTDTIFARPSNDIEGPLEWQEHLPADSQLVHRINRVLPGGQSLRAVLDGTWSRL